MAYEDAYIYVSSNRLPKIATEYDKNSIEYQDLWEPFLERVEFVEFTHRFNSEKDKPQFNYIHICHIWMLWNNKYSDCNSIPENIGIPKLECVSIIQKRKRCEGPRVEMPSFKKRTENDIRWKVQAQLNFDNEQLSGAIPSSLPSFRSVNSDEIAEQAYNEYLMDGIEITKPYEQVTQKP